MRHARTAAGVLGVLLALAGCSSSRSTPTAAPPSTTKAATPASVATTAPPPVVHSSSKPSTPATTPQPVPDAAKPTTAAAAPATSGTCNLPDKGDIIEWQKVPGLPDSAIELGGTDPEHCTWTFDMLKVSSPNGAGYCTKAAWASDNPGYDPNATPAPPLKKVQVAVGDCG